MAQHDYVIANGTGAAVRSDLNNALAAIVSNNSGATEPATMYAYQWWADTSTGLLKLRNAANNAWITLRELDGTLTIEDGTASSPGLAFADDLNTGIYSPSADQLGITTGGTVRLTTTTTAITSALPVDVPLGTASAPTVTFTGDLDTGIYSPGANQVAISTNGSGRLFIGSSGSVGIGSSTPAKLLEVNEGDIQIRNSSTASFNTLLNYGLTFRGTNQVGQDRGTIAEIKPYLGGQSDNDFGLQFRTQATTVGGVTTKMTLTPGGSLGIGSTGPRASLEISDGSTNTAGEAVNELYVVGATTAASEGIVTIQSNDSLAADRGGSIAFGGRAVSASTAGANWAIINGFKENASSANYAGYLSFVTRASGGAFSERARLDSSGRFLVGTSSALAAGGSLTPVFQIAGGDQNSCTQMIRGGGSLNPTLVFARSNGSIASPTAVVNNNGVGGIIFEGYDGTNMVRAAIIAAEVDGTPGTNDMPGKLVFSTTADGASSPTERMRINSGGEVIFGKTADVRTTVGAIFNPAGVFGVTSGSLRAMDINRQNDDGSLIDFYQANTLEGSISVSGTTVSYNGAHLSRWSQLPSGVERTEILRGTVLSNIDEMCEWGEEHNEQLNRMKVSDVEGEKNVAGVFQGWDDDDDTYTNDFYCAMTGDFVIRIAAGVTVERGDLLMSAGDGTAKPQDDDIIRSKTIAKVTSTTVSCTYDDGSYCVPCVLMAC